MTALPWDVVYRDYVIEGMPASGPHHPYKKDIRDSHNAQIAGPFPDNRVIKLNNANEGTPNNIIVSAAVDIPAAVYQVLYILNVTQENTGPVTVSGVVDRQLVTNTSRPIEPGYLQPGMALLCADTGTELRLLSYGDAEAVLAAAEDAAQRAEAAAAGLNLPVIQPRDAGKSLIVNDSENGYELGSATAGYYDSKVAVEGSNIPDGTNFIHTAGYYAAGDGGSALYVRSASEPAHAGKAQSADGAWWEIAETSFTIEMFGARQGNVNTYASANRAAIQAALDTAYILGVQVVIVPTGIFVVSASVNFNKHYTIVFKGFGRNSILKGGYSYTGPIVVYGDDNPGGGHRGQLRDMTIGGCLSGSCTGITALNANTGEVHGIIFDGTASCVLIDDSYALKFSRCHFSSPSNYGIYTYTSCHNLLIDTCWFWSTGLAALSINGHVTNNIVIINSDLEYCNSIIQSSVELAGVTFTGNYVEGTVVNEFNFGAPVYGFICDNNVIELRGAVPGTGIGSGALSTYSNIKSGSFRYNTQYEQNIAFAGSCAGITIVAGAMRKHATGSVSLGLLPYKDPGSLLNAWTKTDSTTFPVGYTRDGDGNVHIKGQITSGAGSSGNIVFTLPVGYRPASRLVFTCPGGAASTVVIVDVNGNIAPTLATGQSLWLNCSFPAVGQVV